MTSWGQEEAFDWVAGDNKEEKPKSPKIKALVRKTKNVFRKAWCETNLLDVLGVEDFKEWYSYNCLTGGDVDGLSYLKVVLRQQDLDYCLLSTWCMAMDDVLQIEEWLKEWKLKKFDVYVWEIFPWSYTQEYVALVNIFKKYDCWRVCVFRNHSKIFAGYGKKYHFWIQTSANINTNPRTENGCIQIWKDIYEFYRWYFDGVKSFK